MMLVGDGVETSGDRLAAVLPDKPDTMQDCGFGVVLLPVSQSRRVVVKRSAISTFLIDRGRCAV